MHLKRLILIRDLKDRPDVRSLSDVEFHAWESRLLHLHAIALASSFQNESDLANYPSLGTDHGARDLLHDMSALPQFCPEGTILATVKSRPVGTIQSLINPVTGYGEIQNVGVVPGDRRKGIAQSLVARAIVSLLDRPCPKITLEVSATNEPALALYRNFGFHLYKTIYAPVRRTDTGAGI
jgi:ribosomal protein S18 acetylase RimI-like enzyme